MERVIKVSHQGGSRPLGETQLDSVVLKPAAGEEGGETFVDMQHQMESELEKRRKDWEKEVEKMQEDFFNVKVAKDGVNTVVNADRTIDVKMAGDSSITNSKPAPIKAGDIFEIGNAKTIYNEKPDGTKVVTFKFDVRGFDPTGLTVRAEGSKVTVSGQYEEEYYPGNKNTRRHNRQVDIPAGVNPDDFVSHLSTDGILTVEAPVTMEIPEPEPDVIDIVEGSAYINGKPLELDYGGDGSRVISASHYSGRNRTPEIEFGGLPNRSIGGSRSVKTTHYGSAGLPAAASHFERSMLPSSSPTRHFGPSTSVQSTKIKTVPPRAKKIVGNNLKGNPRTIIQPKQSEITSVTPGGTVIVHESYSSPYGPKRTLISQDHNILGQNTFEERSSIGRSALGGKSSYGHPNVITSEEGQRCKITVTIGTAYSPEEISVTLQPTKIVVKALHEEVVGGRSSKSEFSREFDIPSSIEPRTFKAVLSPDGRLTIGGSLKLNKKHDDVMALVLCDMPINGRACNVHVD